MPEVNTEERRGRSCDRARRCIWGALPGVHQPSGRVALDAYPACTGVSINVVKEISKRSRLVLGLAVERAKVDRGDPTCRLNGMEECGWRLAR